MGSRPNLVASCIAYQSEASLLICHDGADCGIMFTLLHQVIWEGDILHPGLKCAQSCLPGQKLIEA